MGCSPFQTNSLVSQRFHRFDTSFRVARTQHAASAAPTSAKVRMATAENPGFFVSIRAPKLKSLQIPRINPSPLRGFSFHKVCLFSRSLKHSAILTRQLSTTNHATITTNQVAIRIARSTRYANRTSLRVPLPIRGTQAHTSSPRPSVPPKLEGCPSSPFPTH